MFYWYREGILFIYWLFIKRSELVLSSALQSWSHLFGMKGELWLLLSDQGYKLGASQNIFSHFLAALCHIDLNVSVEGKIINANSLAVKPTNKTCLIHQADIAIKNTLSPLSHSCFPPPLCFFFRSISLLAHLWAMSFTPFTFLCPKNRTLNYWKKPKGCV